MHKRIAIGSITAIHAAASAASLVGAYAETMSRFDREVPPGVASWLLNGASHVLFFPIATAAFALWPQVLPGLLGWIPVLLNSFLWALCLYWVFQFVRGRARARGGQSGEDFPSGG